MELFNKKIVNDLKPFQGLWLFQSANLLLCREKDISAATANGFIKFFHQNLWKTPTKNDVIHRCSSRFSIAPSAGSFTDSHFQIRCFFKHLLWHQNYFGMDYTPPPPFLDLSPHSPPLFNILKTPYPRP